MLDFNNPVTCGLVASRINALPDLAAELANETADAADRSESRIHRQEAPHHGA